MIRKVLGLFLCVGWLQAVYGAAYSKIYVQSGADVVPVEYVKYGAPRVVTNAQIAALSAPPVGSALPLSNVLTPCVSPCVLPTQNVQAVPANAKIISYNAPSVPAVVVPSNDEKSSYEYSYVVYDENTGDRKAQRELSDGSVVHGEYSFVQPDGYIREVKYTADDLTGFNAVVKNFLPESVLNADKKSPEVKDKSEPPPCKETKSEAMKVETEKGHEELVEPSQGETHKPVSESLELGVVPVDHKTINEPAHAVVETKHDTVPAEHSERVPDSETHSGHFVIHINETPEEHAKHGEDLADIAVQTVVPETQAPEHAEVMPHNHDEPSTTQPSVAELIQTLNKEDCGGPTHESVQAPNPQVPPLNGLSAYNDIIKCVQAAIARKDGNAPNISPLTYIILPGASKPC